MHFLEHYYKTVVKHDLMNKFCYDNIYEIPKLKKIILNFECKNLKVKTFVATLLSLELITTKSAQLTRANTPHIFLKIQKGQPVGCKVILKKNYMYRFLTRLLTDIIPNFKSFLKLRSVQKNTNFFSFILLNNSLNFSEIQEHFNLISKISSLQITLVTNAKTQNELFFLLKSFKLPVKKY